MGYTDQIKIQNVHQNLFIFRHRIRQYVCTIRLSYFVSFICKIRRKTYSSLICMTLPRLKNCKISPTWYLYWRYRSSKLTHKFFFTGTPMGSTKQPLQAHVFLSLSIWRRRGRGLEGVGLLSRVRMCTQGLHTPGELVSQVQGIFVLGHVDDHP